ncbi:hypothetical protein SDRG_17110 [Saprolegnia diclina VS20]|uniref:Centrosomal protein of 290kDa coiled-coil region domain-containing protein n=1 Tax=Saprolegnia diclina (strain VS20) TaxID=1156394 RepID=T0PI32_SAPDV|nr:hypothetical protein SDRG_17110 [Saprolegnia diclina VS20]EQC25009.1 hypothetical protein SDRG_17110 [Saprolegnia diclina VS20]|eukprot:XP_008621567.1 hypothetical protein SDRG_17110 [Saprolegnia diclina VS20]
MASPCPRADCSAVQKELEHLRRDVEELQLENDKLHEHSASLSQQVATLQTMNADLREQVQTPRTARAATIAEDEVEPQNQMVTELQANLDASLAREAALADQLAKLDASHAQLAATLVAKPSAPQADELARLKHDRDGRRDELYAALRENEQLRDDNNELRTAVEKLSRVALDAEAKLQVADDEKVALSSALDDRTSAVTELLLKSESHDAEKQGLERKILEMDAAEAHVDAMIADFKTKFDAERRGLHAELEQWKLRVRELEASTPATTTASTTNDAKDAALSDLEAKILVLQDMRLQDKASIAELKAKISQKNVDLSTMAESFVPKDTIKQLEATVQSQRQQTQDALRDVDVWKARVKEQRGLLTDMEARCVAIESQCREAEAWNAKYEAKAGLTDVVRHQKKLRSDLTAQESANAALRVELSRHKDAISKLQAAFARLKRDAGKPDEFEYPDLVLETSVQGNLALIHQLEAQVTALEDERVTLLTKLKDQAKKTGAHLFAQHGLTSAQYDQVQQLIYRLQNGDTVDDAVPPRPSSPAKDPSAELRKLYDANTQLQADVARLSAVVAASSHAPADNPPEWATTVKDEVWRATEALQSHMREHMQVMREAAVASDDESSDESMQFGDLDGDMSAPPPTQDETVLEPPRLTKHASVHTSGLLSPASVVLQELPPSADEIAAAVSKALEARGLHRPTHKEAATPEKKGLCHVVLETQDEMEEQTQWAIELDTCLDELTHVTLENHSLRSKLEAFEGLLTSVQDNHTVLYREHIALQQTFAERRASLEAQLATMTANVDEASIKLNRYELMLQSFEKEGEVQQTVVSLTRQVAIFEVNQARLAREFNLVREEKQTEFTRRVAADDDLLSLEKTLKVRIQYLEAWREGAMGRLQHMETALTKSVLKRHYDGVLAELQRLQTKHAALLEKYTDRHAHYLATLDLPAQHAALLHQNAQLLARLNGESIDKLQNERIQALEVQVQSQLARLKELEAGLPETTPEPAPSGTNVHDVYEQRIAELEQLCGSLERQVHKQKEVATLAASQANTLALRQTRRRDEIDALEARLHELSARSDDDAIIGQLQQKIVGIKANYQAFADRYEQAVEAQRAAQLQINTLSMQLEHTSNHYAGQLETQRQRIAVLESTVAHLQASDVVAKIKRLDAMASRLEALDDDLAAVHVKNRQLERRIEELESEHDAVVGPGVLGADIHLVERLKYRVQVLEQRETLLLAQLEDAAKASTAMLPSERLVQEKQALQAQLDATLFEMDKVQKRMQTTSKEVTERDHKIRQLELRVESLIMELQQKHVAPLTTVAPLGTAPSSPSMRSKVGYYEKDQADLQQAAQATIASLKALVADKNTRIEEYQAKFEAMRAAMDKRASDVQEEVERQNRRLYEDNHLHITQLKEATEKIRHLEETGGGRAVVAAREMHEGLLEQLKQVHMELELKRNIISELQHKVETLLNQRHVAEARAGEALEEIAALKALHAALSSDFDEMEREKTTQLAHLRHEIGSKERKMGLLRDAIIKLKEEFLKAQEAQAEEIVRATSKRHERDDDRVSALQDANTKLAAKTQMLQEKLQATTAELATMTSKAKRAQAIAQKQLARPTDDMKQALATLRDELQRCKAKLGTYAAQDDQLLELQKKIKVLEAQNAALREATPVVTMAPPNATTSHNNNNNNDETTRKQWENEKRMKRRVEVLTTRLEEKKAEVDTLTTQCHRLKEQWTRAQSQLSTQAEQLMQVRAAPLPHSIPKISLDQERELESCHERIRELQAQVLTSRQALQLPDDASDAAKALLEKDTQLLELSFQVESLSLELARLRRAPNRTPPMTPSPARTPTTTNKSRADVAALEDVIENMKRAMEKLRTENDRLRRLKPAKPSATKTPDALVSTLQTQLDQKSHEIARLSAESAELQRKYRTLHGKWKTLRDDESALRNALDEKDRRLDALARQPSNDELVRSLEQHNAQLLEENAKLSDELSAFDLDFFEEIEDLKFKYSDAIRSKQRLERQVAALQHQLR